MRDALDKAGLREDVPVAVWHSDWVVHSQAVGDGQHCLRYLAAYVFRVAISASRIVSCDDGRVVFLYRKSGGRSWRKAVLEAEEFIRRLLQHVLPSGFMKVRHYGFLSPNSALSTSELEELIEDYYGGLVEKPPPDERKLPDPPQVTCPDCGGPMRLVAVMPPDKVYQDSG
jgi:hypothetical protein